MAINALSSDCELVVHICDDDDDAHSSAPEGQQHQEHREESTQMAWCSFIRQITCDKVY